MSPSETCSACQSIYLTCNVENAGECSKTTNALHARPKPIQTPHRPRTSKTKDSRVRPSSFSYHSAPPRSTGSEPSHPIPLHQRTRSKINPLPLRVWSAGRGRGQARHRRTWYIPCRPCGHLQRKRRRQFPGWYQNDAQDREDVCGFLWL